MKCKACHSEVAAGLTNCPSCEAVIPTNDSIGNAEFGSVRCVHCNTAMEKGKKVDRNMTLQVLGVFVFIGAVWMMQFIPIGTIAGLVLMIVAARMGYAKRSGWKCSNCGYFFEKS